MTEVIGGNESKKQQNNIEANNLPNITDKADDIKHDEIKDDNLENNMVDDDDDNNNNIACGFSWSLSGIDISDNDNKDDAHTTSLSYQEEEEQEKESDDDGDEDNIFKHKYNPKKPQWWKKVSGKATKAQRQCRTSMEKQYKLNSVPYGEYISWEEVFSNNNNNKNTMNHSDGTCYSGDKEIWFEIGFGDGDNLLALSQMYPNKYIVGAEIHRPGIGKLYLKMKKAIKNNENWTGYTLYTDKHTHKIETSSNSNNEIRNHAQVATSNVNVDASSTVDIAVTETEVGVKLKTNTDSKENENENENSGDEGKDGNNNNNLQSAIINSTSLYSNLRIFTGDGMKLLPRVPSNSISAILITFPDPFPKSRDVQFRIIQINTLLEMHRVLVKRDNDNDDCKDKNDKRAGRLYIATDDHGFYSWCHSVIQQINENDQYYPIADHRKQTPISTPCAVTTDKDGGLKITDIAITNSNNSNNNDNYRNKLSPPFFSRIVDDQEIRRKEWLPVISKYEQKGWEEGRKTYLSCWEVM